ncbi:transcription factor BIM1 isoform X2 [Sesamum indicum]|uniref:Transcription factor BIM1 isoform X2 n=1 Tax=Sesamum indicum TaxID=4182 RepID=A0A6I9T8T1_SESIN|nr:transcription factor BIM1 isoform X2 [Sesamum indicum]
MELPQSRPLGTEGRKATHDFLSLYSSPPAQQDPTPSQGGYLKTHDFLQPLERIGKNSTTTKDENRGMAAVEKPPVPCPPTSVEHILPGGIGTYSISYFNQRAQKPEGNLFTAQTSSTTRNDENSNCSSYSGGGFTLWDESAIKKGKTGKENIVAERHVLRAGVNMVGAQWMSMLEKPSQSSSNNKHNTATFSSFSSSQPSSSQKNQSFMDMITSAKNDKEEDDDEEEDEFVIKKEPSPFAKGNLSVKVEAKTIDQRPNTPRSKHSATEQRRRSKINDRFQKLREIIPNSDQKRDKASFLLEVIDYIQFLQDKVSRYENSYNAWNHDPSKMMQWRSCHIADGFIDHTRGANAEPAQASVFATKFDENKAGVSSSLPINGQNLVDSDIATATTFKERSQQPELTSKAAPVHQPIPPNIFSFGGTSIAASPVSPKQASDTDNRITWPPSQSQQNACTDDGNKMKDGEPTIESGTINISSVYSQGLLNTLTQALQSSGVDLSQACISVQIDLGKRATNIPHSKTSAAKDDHAPASMPRSGAASAGEEFSHALKRLRTS